VRTGTLLLIILALSIFPAQAQETGIESDFIPEIVGTWDLPGAGAGNIFVNPSDGSIWTFLHQTASIVALDGITGDILINTQLDLRPTALDFAPDGSVIFIVGEPLDDQTIDVGIIQALNPVDGTVIAEVTVEGACSSVHAADNSIIYAASGMQYAYQGTVYRLNWDAEGEELNVEANADCGKIPWAIVSDNEILYVTDLELQWSARSDGSMGPPFGSWVWEYNAETLEFLDKSWVGINPNRLEIVQTGVLVGCSGSKQSEGDESEPALNLIMDLGDADEIFIGTSGASDLAVTSDGNYAVVTLADWGPPANTSGVGFYTTFINPDGFPEAKRWVFTGDIAFVDFTGDDIDFKRFNIVKETFLRSVAISPDGKTVYVLQDEPEKILAVKISD